jgi:HD-GYP domain-containing protein (c-di-GMP phosphodiesterase class II)
VAAEPMQGEHERLEGRGYHFGLRAEQLNREARILAVADVCEALSADRPYRDAMDPGQVRSIMRGDAGAAFCPEALGALEETRELGPVGLATPGKAGAAPRSAS